MFLRKKKTIEAKTVCHVPAGDPNQNKGYLFYLRHNKLCFDIFSLVISNIIKSHNEHLDVFDHVWTKTIFLVMNAFNLIWHISKKKCTSIYTLSKWLTITLFYNDKSDCAKIVTVFWDTLIYQVVQCITMQHRTTNGLSNANPFQTMFQW